MKTFEPKNKKRKSPPEKLPFVQEQLRIGVVDSYIPEIQPQEEKEEERRGIVVIDVF